MRAESFGGNGTRARSNRTPPWLARSKMDNGEQKANAAGSRGYASLLDGVSSTQVPQSAKQCRLRVVQGFCANRRSIMADGDGTEQHMGRVMPSRFLAQRV